MARTFCTALLILGPVLIVQGEISRKHVLRTGPTERLVEDFPADTAVRTEALVDAIWAKDFDAFLEAAASPIDGEARVDEQDFEEIVRKFSVFYRGDLRTMRHPPKWPTPDADRPWIRVSVQRLNSKNVRGQFLFIFGGESWGLERVTLNRYQHADLPPPEQEDPADIIRDREQPG